MSSMHKQHIISQTLKPKRKYATWVYWTVFAVMLAINFALIGLVIWLFKTQNLDQFSTKVGIIASIIAIISAPLILFFTIFKIPELAKERLDVAILPPSEILAKNADTTISSAHEQNITASSPIWNVPYRRNPFFTGREHLLNQLHERLITNKATAITQAQAINGLGGIGKTQVALEYAYRYRNEYHLVFWLNASSRETLYADFTTLANLLHLPITDERDQQVIVRTVNQWVNPHSDYLLIFDNADNLSLLDDFFPTDYRCQIILTTREQTTSSLAQPLEVNYMETNVGIQMLLLRAGLLTLDRPLIQVAQQERDTAKQIVQEMGGLPLALDQAGGYIEETACTLITYLEIYRKNQKKLLGQRGNTGKAHPDPVATTWSLSFTHVEHLNPLAADLLQFCAFLAPDDIPERLVVDGATELGPRLQSLATDLSLLNEAIGTLMRFSLVKRKRDDQTIAVHRLVQFIQKTGMAAEIQQTWAERTVRAINCAFPDVKDYRNWPLCQQYLPHALMSANLITTYNLQSNEAAQLLNKTAYYLEDRAQYSQALPINQRALAITEQVLGDKHPDTATSLNNLAGLYKTQGEYSLALPLYQRAFAIRKQVLGDEHPDTASIMNNLAMLYEEQGDYALALPLYQRALAITEQALGDNHLNMAFILNNLALLYTAKKDYAKALYYYQRALTIMEKVLGKDHPSTKTVRENYAKIQERKE